MLGPVDRYKKYNIFPWKFVIHIISLIVCSYQALAIVGMQTDFAANSQALWYNMFMTEPYGDEITAEYGGPLNIYSIETLRAFVNNVVNQYYQIDSDE